MATDTQRHPSIGPAHPGEMLGEIMIPATGRSKAEIARRLGVSRSTLYDILNQKQPVTPAIAVRLGKLFGDGPGIRMQAAYDTWHAGVRSTSAALRPWVDLLHVSFNRIRLKDKNMQQIKVLQRPLCVL
ncbi:addiction module antidote protein, HigA family [Sinorhizobium medicae]|uniref:Addiction module antidote protein, HigA family n=3 Tax=Sinorhizobium medicae TaxID=110321 RepID=A0ABX4TIP1_9HYPH|nr:addiction module antidote protein, HigA family [Sinorhizobium medicae]